MSVAADGTARATLGPSLAVGAAVLIGVITTLARLVYDDGGNVTTVVFIRCLSVVVILGPFLAFGRRRLALTRSDWPNLLLLGLCIAGMGMLYLGSVAFIPVGLAAIIFYTNPLIVAGYAFVRDPAYRNPVQVVSFALAFAGLVLALGPSFEQTDWRGIVLALLAAMTVAVMLTTSGRLRKDLPVTATNFVGNALAVPILLVLMLVLSEPALPASAAGTWALAAVCGFYVSALLLMFAAIKVSGAVVTALILNLEPLVSIVTAAVLLGETLTLNQYAGSALVLGALVLAAWKPRRRSTSPTG